MTNANFKKLYPWKVLLLIISCSPLPCLADPQPGDIFREYFGKRFSLYVKEHAVDSVDVTISVDDLDHALWAELSVIESHAHIGTGDRSFRVNDGDKLELYKPDAPGSGYCYHYQNYGRMATKFPLEKLIKGENRIRFFKGRQICHDFNWSGWGVMGGFVLRVYYDRHKAHPTGKITSPAKGTKVGDQLVIHAKVKSAKSVIQSVEFLAHYDGYSFDGTGIFDNWHYLIGKDKKWHGHIGVVSETPYQKSWDLRWIPDQTHPMKIAAKITDANGISYITPAVENLTLKRDGRSVKMYPASEVPEKFQSRLSVKKSCAINIPDSPSAADSAKLASIIWQGHLEGKYKSVIGLNNTDLMVIENLENSVDRTVYFPSLLALDLSILKQGSNAFSIFSDTQGHMCEVYWPGPAILISYNSK